MRPNVFTRPFGWMGGLCLLALTICQVIPGSARAEMPPSAYREFQSEAPEALVIEVISVDQKAKKTGATKETLVTMSAKVVKVNRTKTGVKPGTKIQIEYTLTEHERGWVGPSDVPVLKAGTKCPAYLKKTDSKGTIYQPAAGGYSFEKVEG